MDMPNEYYNQGRRRGNQPGGMFYQTPMGMPTSMQSNPAMAMQMQNNYDVASGAYQGQRPPGMGRPPLMPNEMPSQPSPPSMPGMPIPRNPLQAPNFPNGGPGMGGYQGSPGMGGGPETPSPRPDLFPPTTGPTGGTRIPGGPLQKSPLDSAFPLGGGGTAGVAPGEWGGGMGRGMGGGMNSPNTPDRDILPRPGGGRQIADERNGMGGGRQQKGMSPFPPSQRGNNQGGMGAQNSYSSSYNPNTNRNQNTTSGRSGGRRGFAARGNSMPATYNNPNRYSTGGNMNANRVRSGYRGASGSGGYPGQVSGRYQTPRGGGSYDTGGLYSPGSGGRREVSYFPRSPGMPNVTNTSNTYNNRSRNYDQRRTYNTQNTQTFNEGDTSTTQGPRIAKTMGRMQGYNPMMHGSQSRQIGGLRNLQRMLAAMRGGRR
jgi:hypothetical protein